MQNINKDTQIINEYHCHIFSPGWPSVCGIALASSKSSKWTRTLYCRDLVSWPAWVTSFKSQSMRDGHWAGRATASTPKFFCEKIASFCTLTFTINVSWQRQQIVTLLVDMFCSIRFIYWSTIFVHWRNVSYLCFHNFLVRLQNHILDQLQFLFPPLSRSCKHHDRKSQDSSCEPPRASWTNLWSCKLFHSGHRNSLYFWSAGP